LKKIGIVSLAFNDTEDVCEMFGTLKMCINFEEHFVLCIDKNEQEDLSLKKWCYDNAVFCQHVNGEHAIPTCNWAAKKIFENGCEYFLLLHGDMRFDKYPDWLDKLHCFMEQNQKIGRASACNWNHKDLTENVKGSGFSPDMFSAKVYDTLMEKDGYFWDEEFIGVGLWADIDMNRRLLKHGFEVWTCADSKVWHKRGGNRSRYDTHLQDCKNATKYHEKWKDNVLY
jgi:hypothetical protein